MTVTLLNFKLNFLIFFYQSKQLNDFISTDIYCKLSKCFGQALCSYEHYFVKVNYCVQIILSILSKSNKNNNHIYEY